MGAVPVNRQIGNALAAYVERAGYTQDELERIAVAVQNPEEERPLSVVIAETLGT
ncbi:hypothetical protein [Cellulomonas septica]|uniref:Uncharacterized protein n=1 Tax=Cellulomonas septica TaxID=285080 RepID=A0ABX1K2A1_9CELL|nr:hypothetical protein [Cellulomonas septica]NKY39695.1 hypothetical protein [Cellulomonas septica]